MRALAEHGHCITLGEGFHSLRRDAPTWLVTLPAPCFRAGQYARFRPLSATQQPNCKTHVRQSCTARAFGEEKPEEAELEGVTQDEWPDDGLLAEDKDDEAKVGSIVCEMMNSLLATA